MMTVLYLQVRRRGKLGGLMLRGPCMDFNHQNLLAFSMRKTVTENSQRLLSRPASRERS